VNSSLPLAAIQGVGNDFLSGQQDVHLTCAKTGVANCVLNLEWALYQGVALPFRKICGGRRAGVRIIADQTHDHLVLLQEGLKINPLVSLTPEEDNTTFTVSLARSLAPGEDALRLAPPQLSVFNPDVVRAYIKGPLVKGGVIAKHSADLRIDMECLRSGSSRIEITLPIAAKAKFKPITFGFTKRCVMVNYWQQWWVSILLIFCLLFFCSCTVMLAIVMKFQGRLKQKIQDEQDAADAATIEQLETTPGQEGTS